MSDSPDQDPKTTEVFGDKDWVAGVEDECGIVWPNEKRKLSLDTLNRILMDSVEGECHQFDNEIGARIYRDREKLELATPECSGPYTASTLSLYIRAGDEILTERLQKAFNEKSRTYELKRRCWLVKGSTDWKGKLKGAKNKRQWYGRQLDVRVPLSLHYEKIARGLILFLATNMIWAGQGGIAPTPLDKPSIHDPVIFVFSPRALSIVDYFSYKATEQRGFFTVKSWHYADSHDLTMYRRLEILSGDSLLSDYVTWLTTEIILLILTVLAANPDNHGLPSLPEYALSPYAEGMRFKSRFFEEFRNINLDPTLQSGFTFENGETLTALAIQKAYLVGLRRAINSLPLTEPEEAQKALDEFELILNMLSDNPEDLSDRTECWRLYTLANSFLESHKKTWRKTHKKFTRKDGSRSRISDYLMMLSFHAISPDPVKGIWPKLVRDRSVKTLYDDKDVAYAKTRPPQSRAALRREIFKLAKEHGVEIKFDRCTWYQITLATEQELAKRRFILEDPQEHSNEDTIKKVKKALAEFQ